MPNDPSITDSLGWAYFKMGKLDEAEPVLLDAVSRRPESAEIQEHVGDLHHARGRTEAARERWTKALESPRATPEQIERLKKKLAPPPTT